MWEYSKSQLHQAAIDKMKSESDLAASQATAAEKKQWRTRAGAQALKDHEAEKIAVRAKTARLRAARLALSTNDQPKKSTPLARPASSRSMR
jgi:hypothetical protein